MSKLSTLVAALLFGMAGTASAYENFQYFSVMYPNPQWFRGTPNAWGKLPLIAGTAYKYSGLTYVGYVNVPAGSQSFKFDTSLTGDWSSNYGDNYAGDSCLDFNGANIPLTQGAGTYEIRFNTGAQGYGCSRPFYSAVKLDGFTANQRSMYLRTSFNNWSNLPMYLVKNNVWEAPISGSPNLIGQFKLDVKGDWSVNFGRPSGSDPRGYLNGGYATAGGENLSFYIEDYSGATTVTANIRFNDQTKEFALCPNASKALCQ